MPGAIARRSAHAAVLPYDGSSAELLESADERGGEATVGTATADERRAAKRRQALSSEVTYNRIAMLRAECDAGRVRWAMHRNLTRFPSLESPQRLIDALHNLALEELIELERDDGTLNAGGRWPVCLGCDGAPEHEMASHPRRNRSNAGGSGTSTSSAGTTTPSRTSRRFWASVRTIL